MSDTSMWPSLAIPDIYRALRIHRKKAVLWFLVITGTVAVLTFCWPRTYRSEGKLLVRLGRENATLDSTVTLGESAVVAVPLSRRTRSIPTSRSCKAGRCWRRWSTRWGRTRCCTPGRQAPPRRPPARPSGTSRALTDRDRALLLLADNLHVGTRESPTWSRSSSRAARRKSPRRSWRSCSTSTSPSTPA